MDLVAQPVLRLLRGSAVIAQAVGLYNESELWPVEVDAEAVEPLLSFGLWETGLAGDRHEALLVHGVGHREGAVVEKLAERPRAWTRHGVLQRLAQRLRIDQVELVGLVDGPLGLAGRQASSQVDQRADRRRDGDVVAAREVVAGEGPAVDVDSGARAARGTGR